MIRAFVALVALLCVWAVSAPASAHCDTTRGPVVTAARAALDAGDPNLVLHWVRPEDEAAVRTAFQQTLEARSLGPAAKSVADRYFFETVVRIHRAGEGAPYTGLTDDEPEPIIGATDRALETGTPEELEKKLVNVVRAGLAERFAAARAAKNFQPGDVTGGRAFVAAYVPLTHWVEGVFTAATVTSEHHASAVDQAEHLAAQVGNRAESGPTTKTHGRSGRRYLPWILTGLFATAALVEGAFLMRRRHHATA